MNRTHLVDLVNVAARENLVEAIVESLQGKPSVDEAARWWTEPMAAVGSPHPSFMKLEIRLED